MTILGTIASAITGNLYSDPGAMFPLQTITVSATSVSSVTFSNIPQDYAHLQIRALSRCTHTGAGFSGNYYYANSDTTGTNYAWHRMVGDGSSASSYGEANANAGGGQVSATDGLSANIYAASITDIADYSKTNKFKTFKTLTGGDNNGSLGVFIFYTLLWKNTNAITSITMQAAQGNIMQYSEFSLYGIKAAA